MIKMEHKYQALHMKLLLLSWQHVARYYERYITVSGFEVHIAAYIISPVFWDVKQRRSIASYLRFGTVRQSHHASWTAWTLKKGPRLSQSVCDHQPTLGSTLDGRRSQNSLFAFE